MKPVSQRVTHGADMLYDATTFITDLCARKGTPHITINSAIAKTAEVRSTLVDGRRTEHPGHTIIQCIRRRIGEFSGWGKNIAGLRKVKLRGLQNVRGLFTFTMAAYNLIVIPKLLPVAS